jgi:anti-sigma factor RsiW
MSDVVCRAGVEHLMDYMEGALPPHMRAALDEHVAGCAKCVAFIAAYEATPRIVREATEFEPPASAERDLRRLLKELRSGAS